MVIHRVYNNLFFENMKFSKFKKKIIMVDLLSGSKPFLKSRHHSPTFAIHQLSLTNYHQSRTIIIHQLSPFTDYRLSSFTNYQSPIINHQLSITNYQHSPTIIIHQLSIINYHHSSTIIIHQLSITIHQLSFTIYYHSPTMGEPVTNFFQFFPMPILEIDGGIGKKLA